MRWPAPGRLPSVAVTLALSLNGLACGVEWPWQDGGCLGWVKDSVIVYVNECGEPAVIDGVRWSREGDGSGELACGFPRVPCPRWLEAFGWGTFTLTIYRGDETWEETVVVRPTGPECTQPITEELWVEIGTRCDEEYAGDMGGDAADAGAGDASTDQ